MKSINLIVQKYVWKVEYPSNYCNIHLNLMKNRTLKEMMDALFISSGLHKTCVEELSLLQKGTKKLSFHKESNFVCSGQNLFHMTNGKDGNST